MEKTRTRRRWGRLRSILTMVALTLGLLIRAAGATPTPTPTLSAVPTPPGRPAVKCQAAIQKAGVTFVAKELAILDKCANGILKCIQTKTDGPEQHACIAKAGQKCAQPNGGAFAKIAAEETKLVAAIRKSCEVEGLSAEDLRRIDGLGFESPAIDCPSIATVEDIAACIAAQHECRAEQLFVVEEPRARELIEEAASAAGLSLPPLNCLPHLGDGENLDDPKGNGKLVVQCESTIKKTAAKFVSKKLRSIDKCVGTIFSCVQTKAGADQEQCLAKAGTVCAKEFGKTLAELIKVRPAVDKKCISDPADFADVYDTVLGNANGANLAGPSAECALVDAANPATYEAYKDCLVDQHGLRADDLVRFQTPRTDELLALIGCELDGLACGLKGVSLKGDPDDPAAEALVEVLSRPAKASDIVDGVILTRLEVYLAPGATVGQVNAALESVAGGIVSMSPSLPVVGVVVPRQADAAALQAVADQLKTAPGILWVTIGSTGSLDAAPPAPADGAISHLVDSKFPAAFNAKALAEQSCELLVTVIVPDSYHRPVSEVFTNFSTQVPGVSNIGGPSLADDLPSGEHGYDVLGTLAGVFDATVPTGANPLPNCLNIAALQAQGVTDADIIRDLSSVLPAGGKVVISSSRGFGDGCKNNMCDAPANVFAPRAVDRALLGASARFRFGPLRERLLILSSAGNNKDDAVAALYPGTGRALANSALNVAAITDPGLGFAADPDLWEPTAPCLPPAACFPSLTATPQEQQFIAGFIAGLEQADIPLDNVVKVGSTDGLNPSTFSEEEEDLNATGEGIPTFRSGERVNGTSFAVPQVAGLATYLWLLSPELRARPVADTIAAMKANAETVLPAKQIDAYATVLSLDQATAVTPASARVRLAILDTVKNGHFDAADVQAFHDAYVDSGLPIEPTTADFSRHDLNGDGFTGGTTRTTRMDLDPDGSTRFGAPVLSNVTTEVVGEERTFDESAVSDLDALCYYANSGLYTGSAAQRDEILADIGCGESPLPVFAGTITETFDAVTGDRTVSSTETYTARLEYRADGGITTRGSARLVLSLEEQCNPGNLRNLIDASTTDRIRDDGDADTFEVAIEADVEGSLTETGTGECEEDFVEPFEGTIQTDVFSTPEFVGNRVVALVWNAEIDDAQFTDPFGNVYEGVLRITGRLGREN